MINRLYIIIIALAFLNACEKNTSPEQSITIAHQAIKNGELNKAIILIKKAIQLNENDADADLRVSLGKIYLTLGDLDYAAKELNTAKKLGAPTQKWLLPLMQINYLQNENVTISNLWQENKQDLDENNSYEANLFYAL